MTMMAFIFGFLCGVAVMAVLGFLLEELMKNNSKYLN
jgi:hypothetical protein